MFYSRPDCFEMKYCGYIMAQNYHPERMSWVVLFPSEVIDLAAFFFFGGEKDPWLIKYDLIEMQLAFFNQKLKIFLRGELKINMRSSFVRMWFAAVNNPLALMCVSCWKVSLICQLFVSHLFSRMSSSHANLECLLQPRCIFFIVVNIHNDCRNIDIT